MKRKLLAVTFLIAAGFALQGCKKSEQSPVDTAASSPGASQSAETIELKAKWPVGNNYTYRMDLTQSMKMQFPGMPQPIDQVVTLAQTHSTRVVAERPNSGREIELQFEAMEMDMQMGGMTMSFDSKADAEADRTNPFAAPFRKVIGSKLKLFVGSNGEVESIENLDEWQNKILADAPPPAQMMIQSMYSPDSFKQMVETAQGLPTHAVKIGENWPYKTEMGMGPMGKIAIDTKVKLKGFEQRENRRCAVLESTGTLKGGGGTAGPMGKMSIEQGKVTGTSWFDPELGAMVAADSDQKMQLKIEPPAGAPGGNKPFSGDVTQKVTIKLVDLKTSK